MSSKQVVFADRVVGIGLQSGLVRIDLAVITGPGRDAEDRVGLKLEATHQLVLPLEALTAAVQMQQKLLEEVAARRSGQRNAGDAAPMVADAPAS